MLRHVDNPAPPHSSSHRMSPLQIDVAGHGLERLGHGRGRLPPSNRPSRGRRASSWRTRHNGPCRHCHAEYAAGVSRASTILLFDGTRTRGPRRPSRRSCRTCPVDVGRGHAPGPHGATVHSTSGKDQNSPLPMPTGRRPPRLGAPPASGLGSARRRERQLRRRLHVIKGVALSHHRLRGKPLPQFFPRRAAVDERRRCPSISTQPVAWPSDMSTW